jgi:hypothetical protein
MKPPLSDVSTDVNSTAARRRWNSPQGPSTAGLSTVSVKQAAGKALFLALDSQLDKLSFEQIFVLVLERAASL